MLGLADEGMAEALADLTILQVQLSSFDTPCLAPWTGLRMTGLRLVFSPRRGMTVRRKVRFSRKFPDRQALS